MRGMILAAGKGERMGPLTEKTPKPLLKVGGSYLIEYAIQTFLKAGIKEIVINVSYLKDQIMAALGDGSRYGVKIAYSEESDRLETGGGIVKALPLLGTEPFIVLSADIITDFPLARLFQQPLRLAHLVLVENPSFHPKGDYGLNQNGELEIVEQGKTYTFASIGIYRPELFASFQPVYHKLADLWKEALLQRQITGECYQGLWYNLGQPQDLAAVEANLAMTQRCEQSQ